MNVTTARATMQSRMRPPERRGQTMVLFALTLLLLTLMVMMTLSFGTKVKEKMELQTVADAAAYSNSVAVARAYNGISQYNRVMVSHMVALSATEAAISFSGSYRGYLGFIYDTYNKWKKPWDIAKVPCCLSKPCIASGACACLNSAINNAKKWMDAASKADSKVQSDWDSLDKAAGLQARAIQGSAGSFQDKQQALYFDLMLGELLSNRLTEQVVDEARKGNPMQNSEWQTKGLGFVNLREAGAIPYLLPIDVPWVALGGAGILKRPAYMKNHQVSAIMGSRGDPFVTARAGVAGMVQTNLVKVLTPPETILINSHIGNTTFDSVGNAAYHGGSPSHATAQAHDRGSASITWGGGPPLTGPWVGVCTPPVPYTRTAQVRAEVTSTHDGPVDYHNWSFPTLGSCPADSANDYHTMGECTACPGVMPILMDYNFTNVTSLFLGGTIDNYGQPRQLGVVQRDYAQRQDYRGIPGAADPWNLFFRFRFSPGGNEGFDGRGIQLGPNNRQVDSGDISKQTAIASGVAYYHRRGLIQGGWGEPPNWYNPFWRATLMQSMHAGGPSSRHVDEQAEDDIDDELDKAPFAKDAYRALQSAGYTGWH